MPKMVVGEQVEALVDEEDALDYHDHVDQVDRSLELRGFLFVIGKCAHGSMSRPHLLASSVSYLERKVAERFFTVLILSAKVSQTEM